MTYFTFLGIFLILPILVLLVVLRRQDTPFTASPMSAWPVIGIHVLLAVIWTTPWDNYLVASGVWWYDTALVTGLTLGYVPIEEYTFFVLQPILTGLWLLFWMPRLSRPSLSTHDSGLRFRLGTTLAVGVVWLAAGGLLLSDYDSFNYLGLELVWALPPVMLQTAFGADILRRQWRLALVTIGSATLFLSVADSIAIGAGTWTIDPAQSTGFLLGGILPIEELIFFLLTNTLIVFGSTLALADESKLRLKSLGAMLKEFNPRLSTPQR